MRSVSLKITKIAISLSPNSPLIYHDNSCGFKHAVYVTHSNLETFDLFVLLVCKDKKQLEIRSKSARFVCQTSRL